MRTLPYPVSPIVRTVLGSLLATQPPGRVPRTMVVGTPAGEQHELGALLAGLLAAVAGWDVLYLGPNVPAGEILAAARNGGAAAVAISIVNLPRAVDAADAEGCLAALAEGLPATVALVAGGAGASGISVPRRVRRFDGLRDFDDWLRADGPAPAGRVA